MLSLLKVLEYFAGASEEALREVAAVGRVTRHEAGEVVHEANAPLATVGFVLSGRLKVVRVDARGGESPFRMIGRGEQYGMMVGALTEPVPIRVVALEPIDPMLRKYLHDWRLEQFTVPCLTVTVDLVSGTSVVRDRGDGVHAILESINLPVLSVPIVREGRALIDGGLVNNIPADVLVARGCNFVIAVSVSAKKEKEFCQITPGTAPRKKPGTVQTLLRSLLVQNHSVNAFGVQPADLMIAPDKTGFDMAAFTRAEEMAAIGRAAGLDAVPNIRTLLSRLDPQLFPPAG